MPGMRPAFARYLSDSPISLFRFGRALPFWALALALLASGCRKGQDTPSNTAPTPVDHTKSFFKIDSGAHMVDADGNNAAVSGKPVDCAQCHSAAATTFKTFTCTGCHAHSDQSLMDQVHPAGSTALQQMIAAKGPYAYDSAKCYTCHSGDSGQRGTFDHAGISSGCNACHAAGAVFYAIDASLTAYPTGTTPKQGFTHQILAPGVDCSACHSAQPPAGQQLASWSTSSGPAGLVSDAVRSVPVTGQLPSWSGTTITALTPQPQTLLMGMLHSAAGFDAVFTAGCVTCHSGAASGAYYPGVFHASLDAAKAAQPSSNCAQCHTAAPTGFVGPVAASPQRWPSSGEMRHDAVLWTANAPTQTPVLVGPSADCSLCHVTPKAAISAPWRAGIGGGNAKFHASLTAASLAQPASCLDCHANNRPSQAPLTSATAAVPAGVVYDHTIAPSHADCATCHNGAGQFTAWAGGRYHHPGDAANAQTTCLPCHSGERPSATLHTPPWTSSTWNKSPFDYVTNTAGVPHGNGMDCVSCHAGPGTGAWGSTQNWQGGAFDHLAAGSPAQSTCIVCHSTQRPDLNGALPGVLSDAAGNPVDHSQFTGDCTGCHLATVQRARFVDLGSFSGTVVHGDWQGGVPYPGASLVGAASQVTQLNAYQLLQTDVNRPGVVTTFAKVASSITNQMNHASAAIPSQFALANAPADSSGCWHCHATTAAGTLDFSKPGQLHASLANFTATKGGAVTPLTLNPGSKCTDCHAQRPANLLQPGALANGGPSDLAPMDHFAAFSAAVTLGGVSATSTAALDCVACHLTPTGKPTDSWASGTFHKNVGAAQPKDCTVCHFLVMADAATADVTSGASYSMKHGSTQLAKQNCQACHAGAMANVNAAWSSSASATAPALWKTGAFHQGVAAQPTACIDCHSGTQPTQATFSSVSYLFAQGAATSTPGNGPQVMNHASPLVAGRDCAACHKADATSATTASSVWSKSDSFHAAVRPASTCTECHGTGNGNGSVAGTGNNLPVGLIDSITVTSVTSTATGVVGLKDRILHTDASVTAHDCAFCHTQQGVAAATSTARGKEWAQAYFHASFTGGAQLVLDGNAGRCSNCHLNLKPAASFTAWDHSAYSAQPGTTDCAACHVPGGSWAGALLPLVAVADAAKNVTLTAKIAAWSGPVIASFTSKQETLTQPMLHSSASVPAALQTNCAACHVNAASKVYSGGAFHQSLTTAGVAQPTACADCHSAPTGASLPTGFVGPTAASPARVPPSGEMPHDAVIWANGAKTNKPVVTQDCSACHAIPSSWPAPTGWAKSKSGGAAAQYHASLGASGQPGSCIDCHANSRPSGTAAAIAVTDGTWRVNFDHTAASTLADCTACHTASAPTFTAWGSGKFHVAGNPAPVTCLSCHTGSAPAGKTSSNVTYSYLLASGSTPGNGVQLMDHTSPRVAADCFACHAADATAPATTWSKASRFHANAPSVSSCQECHLGNAPSAATNSTTVSSAAGDSSGVPAGTFDQISHQDANVAGHDCTFCHTQQGPSTAAGVQGKEWAQAKFHAPFGGGALLLDGTSGRCSNCHLNVKPTAAYLTFSHAAYSNAAGSTDCAACHTVGSDWKTSIYPASTAVYDAGNGVTLTAKVPTFTSTPPSITSLGSLAETLQMPMVHTSASVPTSLACSACHASAGSNNYKNGIFHAALRAFALPQPTACLDCHSTSDPTGFVGPLATNPVRTPPSGEMPHDALVWTSNVRGTQQVLAQVGAADCVSCHVAPTSTPALTGWAAAKQAGKSAAQFHASLTAAQANKLTSCLDCHANSRPASAVTTNVPAGVSFDHTFSSALNDCLLCHASSATSWASWSGGRFHDNVGSGSITQCTGCHSGERPTSTAGWKSTTYSQPQYQFDYPTHGAPLDCIYCHLTPTSTSAGTWVGGNFGHGAQALGSLKCTACHSTATPAALTASLVNYGYPNGGSTASNVAQWMSHAAADVTGKANCNACHVNDLTTAPPAWSKGTSFHANASATACTACHGGDAVKNNLPSGAINTVNVSLASNNPLTGVATGTYDLIDHTDINVTANDCKVCHTQVGVSAVAGTAPGNQGYEWEAAKFHASVGTLTLNGTTGRCSTCHFNLVPGPTYLAQDHSSFNKTSPTDCALCHKPDAWTDAIGGAPTGLVFDARVSLQLAVGVPTFSGTVMTALTVQTSTLPMPMLHGSSAANGVACATCHLSAATTGSFYPGTFHDNVPVQPSVCGDCHSAPAPDSSVPLGGLVGMVPTSTPRSPPSGEMRHDAVAWAGSVRGTTALVTQDCTVCHSVPDGTSLAWSHWLQAGNGAQVVFHAALAASSMAQPTSCLDCHANSRPTGIVTSANSALAAGVAFDHTLPAALADCVSCHSAPVTRATSWAGGRFHLAGSATPASCLPCHEGERPTAAIHPPSGWTGLNLTTTTAPFDYVPNVNGVSHGAGLDCIACHTGAGTGGLWGSSQNWTGGSFNHAATGSLAASTCLTCHSTQRPDLNGATPTTLQDPNTGANIDHSTFTGDCFACHQATVSTGKYTTYGSFSGTAVHGNWNGGVSYPGHVLAGSTFKTVSLTEITLVKSGALVTGMTSATSTLVNQMMHDSTQVPDPFNMGPSTTSTKYSAGFCWRCHSAPPPTPAGSAYQPTGTITTYSQGDFHDALNATVTSTGTPLTGAAQPTSCADCHTAMRPAGIVQLAGSDFAPMDHTATWPSATITTSAGKTIPNTTGVPSLDCFNCHRTSLGGQWSDGIFHANTKGATPADCTVCHYTLLADTAKSDKVNGTFFAMKHASAQVKVQNCQACHTGALAAVQGGSPSTTTTANWSGALFHKYTPSQPVACADCHTVTTPAAQTAATLSYSFTSWTYGSSTSTQSSSTVAQAQFMNHASPMLAGKECSACHQADATTGVTTATAWSKSDTFHTLVTASSCKECHGLTNGGGAVAGTNNDLPPQLTSSSVVSTASGLANSGIPANTYDQISHMDPSVTSRDCNACHRQQGPSTTAGIQGKEWAQASYHANVAPPPALCAQCHLNVMPTNPAFTGYNHLQLVSGGTVATGAANLKLTTDCSGCHTQHIGVNWLDAAGAAPHTVSFLSTNSCVNCHTVGGPTTNTGATLTSGTAIGMPTGLLSLGNNKLSFYHVDPNGKYDLSATSCIICHNSAANSVLVSATSTNIINALITLAPWGYGDLGAPSSTPNTLTNTTKVNTQGGTGYHFIKPTAYTYSVPSGQTAYKIVATGGTAVSTCFPCHATDSQGLNQHCANGQTQILTECANCHRKPSGTRTPSWSNPTDGTPVCQ
jgi:NapC/NirT cytochrome c family, N-terminal region